MTSDRKKLGVAFWATVVVTVLVLYVLSAGPAQIALIRQLPVRFTDPSGKPITSPMSMDTPPVYDSAMYSMLYAPLGAVVETPAGELLNWYLGLFRDMIPVDSTRSPTTLVLELYR